MTLETEQCDPVKTHWVRIAEVSLDMPYAETILEGIYTEMNRQAIKADKVILNLSHQAFVRPSTIQFTIAYIVTAQVVDRKILEQQQFKQWLTRN